jgi:hypothetical protein
LFHLPGSIRVLRAVVFKGFTDAEKKFNSATNCEKEVYEG